MHKAEYSFIIAILLVLMGSFVLVACAREPEMLIVNNKDVIEHYYEKQIENKEALQGIFNKHKIVSTYVQEKENVYFYLDDGSILRMKRYNQDVCKWTIYVKKDLIVDGE